MSYQNEIRLNHQGRRAPTLSTLRSFAFGSAIAVALSGCATMVEVPKEPRVAERLGGTAFDLSMQYLYDARTKMTAKLVGIDQYDRATKAGVGLGVAGAAIASVFHSPTNPILGFVSLGALSYGANQQIDPAALENIYQAGLTNLDCIDKTAVSAYDPSGQASQKVAQARAELISAIKSLQQDISDASAYPTLSRYVEDATSDIATAQTPLAAVNQYLGAKNISEQVLYSVNLTIDAVNRQLLSKSPTLDSIAKSGGALTAMLSSATNLSSQIAGARAKLMLRAGQTVGDNTEVAALERRFIQDGLDLKAALSHIPPNLDIGDAAAIAQCKTQFGVGVPLVVTPGGPIELDAGTAVSVAVSGGVGSDYTFAWNGNEPTDVQKDATAKNPVRLIAGASPQEKSYSFYFTDGGPTPTRSNVVLLNVHAKTAAPVRPPKAVVTPPQSGPSVQSDIIGNEKYGGISNIRALLELPATAEQGTAEWSARVKALKNCLKIKPPTGYLTSVLMDGLTTATHPILGKNNSCAGAAPAVAPGQAAGAGPPAAPAAGAAVGGKAAPPPPPPPQ